MKNPPFATILHLLHITLTALLCLYGSSAAAEAMRFDSGPRQVTLVELYTSQGCSSCPPAERWLGQLKDDPRLWHDLVPVAFHVDYWDYLGWRDTLAAASHSQRQRRYHSEGKLRAVYTPAFVVNGKEWRSWFGLRRLPASNTRPGRLTVTLEKHTLHASFTPATELHPPLLLHVALLGVDIKAAVTAGENSGRALAQDFAVLMHQRQRSDTGSWNMPLTLPLPPAGGRLALAAWVSATGEQGPLQATGGWLQVPGQEESKAIP